MPVLHRNCNDRSGSKPEITAPQQQRPLPLNQRTLRQPDIERRLSNLARARRVGREREPVTPEQAAVTGRARCRMHGGARGSGGPHGDRNGNFKHGVWTRENVETRMAVRAQIREIRALLRATQPGTK
jgi:hypothetical protein